MSRRTLPALAGILCLAMALGGCQGAAPSRAGAQRPGVLRKCTLLIPLAYNDGTAVPPEVVKRIEDRLFGRFGGYTIAGTANGTYRMSDGTRAKDRSLVLWVAVPPNRVAELRREAAELARELRQESIYFEVSGAAVEFVEPSEPDR